MDSENISEWLATILAEERLRALAILYSDLTVRTRQLFVPSVASKERNIIDVLHGINELHHTVANQIVACSFGEEGYPSHVFVRQLADIADQYGLRGLLTQAIDFVRSRNLSSKG